MTAQKRSIKPDYEKVAYKRDLLHRMGGSSFFELALVDLCESIKQDETLSPVYKDIAEDDLFRLQQDVFYTAIAELPVGFSEASEMIAARHTKHNLFDRGLEEAHFDVILDHFEVSMHCNLLDQDVIDDVLEEVRPFRSGFVPIVKKEAEEIPPKPESFEPSPIQTKSKRPHLTRGGSKQLFASFKRRLSSCSKQ